jgi:hypothetical protein
VDAILQKVVDLEKKLNDMQAALEANQKYIMQLLNTPQGQRPDFPTKP